MKTYKVTCYSKCGSYFGVYLQSVTVIADNEADAIKHAKEWLAQTGREFIYPENEWHVFEESNSSIGVVDYIEDSDY